MDDNRYPTEEEKQEIRDWEWNIDENNPNDIPFIERLLELWSYADRCSFKKHKNGNWKLLLNTSGWSGNEELIEALESQKQPNFFFWFWQKSERGGHYWFKRSMNSKTKASK